MSADAEFATSLQNFDADSDSWKIYGGFNVNEYFGLELTYYDLGNFSDSSGATAFDADISAWDVSMRGILPAGKRLAFFGKLGFSSLDVESTTSSPLVSTSTDVNNWELFYALGVELKLGERFGIRAEWETWDTDDSLDAWSLGAYFRFGAK